MKRRPRLRCVAPARNAGPFSTDVTAVSDTPCPVKKDRENKKKEGKGGGGKRRKEQEDEEGGEEESQGRLLDRSLPRWRAC
jgi:hypothetical protein